MTIWIIAAALLVSLTIYVLSGGADYGRGIWDLLASGPRAEAQRELIVHSTGPIWEADHVWLILVVVILFTAFAPVFATIMTALHIPVSLMLIGIVLRDAAFSFRAYGAVGDRAQRRWGGVFAIASLVTPILLGVIIGAVASGCVPLTPQHLADFVTPWLRPFPLSVGFFALSLFAYLAATYLAYFATDEDLSDDFRRRAIGAAIAAGVMAGITLLLSIHGAPPIWLGLTHRRWTWPLIWSVTGLALGALYALWTNHLLAARTCAQGQVTLILWGWAFAQFPVLVEPNLTIYNAAAPLITQRMLVGLLIVGGLVLMPSFRYLLIVFESHPRHLRRGTNPLH